MLHILEFRKQRQPVPNPTFEELIEAMKLGASILERAGIPFMLGGGLAIWARGGPRSEHDVDLVLPPEDADAALEAFARAGLRTERPPEDWLYKAWHANGVMIDLIFRPAGGSHGLEDIERAPVLEVMAMRLRVMTPEDVMTSKLMALTEQEPNFHDVLELARAIREQIDWDVLRARTDSSPFAKAFFTLVKELGILSTNGVVPPPAALRSVRGNAVAEPDGVPRVPGGGEHSGSLQP
jgi:hypothetical protein